MRRSYSYLIIYLSLYNIRVIFIKNRVMVLLKKKTAVKYGAKPVFSTHWLYTLYLAWVSAIAVIVLSINLGILITSVGKYVLITDQEYILSWNAWQVQQCSEPRWENNTSIDRTPEEISTCEEKATTSALAQRSINLKETFIESFAWFTVFGLLFWFHYPKFLATREKK